MDQPQQPQPASSPVPAPSFTPSEQNPIIIDHKHRPILGGAFLIIALALSILAGRLLFANYWPNTDEPMVVTTPTPSASAAGVPTDWKTYTNARAGLKFMYPVGLVLHQNDNNYPGIELRFADTTMSVEFSETRGLPDKSTEVVFGEIIGYQTDVPSERGTGTIRTIYLQKPNGTFLPINLSGEYAKEFSTISKILTTFNFTYVVDVSDWKTYRHDEYGFEIKYPTDWISSENRNANPQHTNIFEIRHIDYGSVSVVLQGYIATSQNYAGRTYGYSSSVIGAKNVPWAQAYNKNQQAIEGIYEVKFDSVTASVVVAVAENAQAYTHREKWNKLDDILSTFKFIEQTSLVPADWKAYVNPEYTIKYPPTWNFVENSDVSVGFYSASIGTPKDPRSYRVSLFRQPAETYPEFISNTTIGGLPAFTETLTREGSAIDNGGKFTQTYVTRANRDYYFLLNAGYESEIETYNRMLSTLTFTGILIKPGWTPHLSELYGFEIQYPNTFSRTSNSGENQVLALTGRTNTQGYFSVSVYRLPLRPTDGVPCSEGAMGGLQSHVINGTVTLSGATYPKCIISRSNDQALQVSFNKNGYTWLFQATAYDSQKNIIEQIFSTFKFTE